MTTIPKEMHKIKITCCSYHRNLHQLQGVKILHQAEQIAALKEKNCELAHIIGHLGDDINEQERHTEDTQQVNQRLKEELAMYKSEVKNTEAANPQGGDNDEQNR